MKALIASLVAALLAVMALSSHARPIVVADSATGVEMPSQTLANEDDKDKEKDKEKDDEKKSD